MNLQILRTATLTVALLVAWSSSAQQTGSTRVLVEVRTEHGTMLVALYNETPRHRDNFLEQVREGFHDGLLFHRVVPGLMIEGGDPGSRTDSTDGSLEIHAPGHTLPAEIVPGLAHVKGAIGAVPAGEVGNPGSLSHPSRFYITLGRTYERDEVDAMAARHARLAPDAPPLSYDEQHYMAYARDGGSPHLDGRYTIFGAVVDGFDVLDKLAAEPCDAQDRPITDLRMWMRVLE